MKLLVTILLVVAQQCLADYSLTVKMQQVTDVLGLLPSGKTCDDNAWWCTSVSWPDCGGCDLMLEFCVTSPGNNCSDPTKYVDFGRISQDQATVNLTSKRYNGIANPVEYRLLGPWEGSNLFFKISDLDMLSSNDFIDMFHVKLDELTVPGSGYHAMSETHKNGNATTNVMFSFGVKCDEYFTGQMCEKSCVNGGSLQNGSCVCPDPFTGYHCQDLKCQNNGTSFNGKCICPPGLNGTLCQTIICHNAGWALSNLTCQCTDNWSGKHCDTPVCQHGRPEYLNKCVCGQGGWTGEFCETIVCGDHGSRVNSTTVEQCTCDIDWTGQFCNEIQCEYGGSVVNNTCACTPLFTGMHCQIGPRRHCQDLLDYYGEDSGVKTVRLPNGARSPMLCEMVAGIGYTVVQSRSDSKQTFDQNWTFYEVGFGSLTDDFYWGNSKISKFTGAYNFGLRVEVTDCNGATWFEQYDSVTVGDAMTNYTLTVSATGTGNAGDAFNFMVQGSTENGMQFTTKDRDHDVFPPVNCAMVLSGGWWYSACGASNLNGQFDSTCSDSSKGINWYTTKYSAYSFKSTRMMLVAK